MVHFNGTKAAIESGYSKETAKAIGSNLIAKPYIAHAIQQRLDERRLEHAGRIQHLMDKAYAIAMSEKTRHSDALKAIELSGKFLGIGFDKVQHNHTFGTELPTIASDATPAKAIEVYATLLN